MHKVTFAERRSGQDRRLHYRRSLLRWLKRFWHPSTYRRCRIRRAPYIRGETYTLYLSDRI